MYDGEEKKEQGRRNKRVVVRFRKSEEDDKEGEEWKIIIMPVNLIQIQRKNHDIVSHIHILLLCIYPFKNLILRTRNPVQTFLANYILLRIFR